MALRPHAIQTLNHKHPVGALALAIERREMFSAGDSSHINVWSLDDGHMTRSFEAHTGSTTALTWLSHTLQAVKHLVDSGPSSKTFLRHVAKHDSFRTEQVWNVKGDKVAKAKFPCALYSSCYSAPCDFLVIGGKRKMLVMKLEQIKEEWTLSPLASFEEHSDFVCQIVCTPKPLGRVFSCGYDGFICAFELNVEDRLVVMSVSGVRAKARCHKSAITCASYNAVANQLITGGYDMVVKTWNHDSLTAHAQFIPLHTLNFSSTIHSIAYVPCSNALWVCVEGFKAPRVFDTRTGTDLSAFLPAPNLEKLAEGDFPKQVVASMETKELVTISQQQVLVTWRFDPQESIAVVRGHSDWIELLLRTPGINPELISAGADSSVRRWHCPTPLYPQLYALKDIFHGHFGGVCCGAVNEEGTVAFTGGDDGTIRGWALDDAMVAEAAADVGEVCRFVMEGHDGRVTGMCVLYHYVVSVAQDQAVRIWDGNTGTLWRVIEDAHSATINDVAANPDDGTFATCGSDGLARVWAYDPCEMICGMEGHTAEISKVRWSPFYAAWVTGADDSTLRMWHPTDGRPLTKGEVERRARGQEGEPDSVGEGEVIMMKLNTDRFTALEVVEADGSVAAGLTDLSVVILDLLREVLLKVFVGHQDQVRAMVLIPEKGQLMTAGWDHSIRVWNLAATKLGRGVATLAKSGSQRSLLARKAEEEELERLEREQAQATRPFAEKVPPLDPKSLKYETSLFRAWEEETSPALAEQDKREQAKQAGHMSWILRCIEEGNEDAIAQARCNAGRKPHPGGGTARAVPAPAGARAAGRDRAGSGAQASGRARGVAPQRTLWPEHKGGKFAVVGKEKETKLSAPHFPAQLEPGESPT